MSYTLSDLAERYALELRGDGDVIIDGIASIASAQPGQLSFLIDPKYSRQLSGCSAAAVLLGPKHLGDWDGDALVSQNPAADYARIAALFDPIKRPEPGVHGAAYVDPDALLGIEVSVGATAVIEAGAVIGDRAVIGAGCFVGRNARIGADTWLVANVTILDRVVLGERVHIQPGAVLGGRGFGLAPEHGAWLEVPQLGAVRVGNDVEIGANSCIDRGAMGDTVIEDGVKIDNLVQIGHNSHIGEHTAIAGCVGIAGSSTVGARCQLGGGVGLAGHLQIVDDVIITGFSLVSSSVEQPGVYSAGVPVVPAREWRRQVARLRNIDDLSKRVKKLEKGPE